MHYILIKRLFKFTKFLGGIAMIKRKHFNFFIAFLILTFIILSINGEGFSQDYDNIINEDWSVREIELMGDGNSISDYQLGFLNPESYEGDDFDGWLMMYSEKDLKEVWEHLQSLAEEDLNNYWSMDDKNRIYKINEFDWADGVGNTFNTGQRDLVTGEEFSAGIYKTYVATYVEGEIKALNKGDNINVKPYPKDVSLIYKDTTENIDDYGLNYSSYTDDRLKYNFLFYSSETLYEIQDYLESKKLEDYKRLADNNRGKLTEELDGPLYFKEAQNDLYNNTELTEGTFSAFIASVGEDGKLGIIRATEMIITEDIPEPKDQEIGDGYGSIFAIGGGASLGDPENENIFADLRERAGGNEEINPRIAVLSSSRESESVAYNHFYYDDPTYGSQLNNLKELGYEAVYIPIAIDSRQYVKNNEYWANLLKTSDAVFLMGGDQYKHVRSLFNDDGTESKIMEALHHIYNRGGVIAGSSAGMHFMSNPVFGVGDPYESFYYNQTEEFEIKDIPEKGYLYPKNEYNNLVVPASSFVPDNVLTDTHFDARGRLGRLIVGLRDTDNEIGIGADEGTAMVFSKNQNGSYIGEVIGDKGVFVVDSKDASYENAGLDKKFGVENIRLHYLVSGDKYNFDDNEVYINDDNEILEAESESIYESNDIFESYETTKALYSLINSKIDYCENYVYRPDYYEDGPEFKVTFSKSQNSKAYDTGANYLDVEILDEYNKKSIINIQVDVKALSK